MLKRLKELESAILYKLDILQINVNTNLICADKEPIFKMTINALCSVVTKPVPQYESEDELTKLNLFMRIEINNISYQRNLIQFLKEYTQCVRESDVITTGDWYPFIDEDNSILVKITDHTEYYAKNKTGMKAVDMKWDLWNEKFNGNRDVTIVISRGYDVISEKSYLCLNQISDTTSS